jgi:periplasmic divalent cation tolerance protein
MALPTPSPIDPAAQLWLALTTEASDALAEALARRLLTDGLVACVSLQPLRSLYVWQGRLDQAQEVQLLLKTDGVRLADLEAAVHRLHSYETPEWIAWPASGSVGYSSWLRGVLDRGGTAGLSADVVPPAP